MTKQEVCQHCGEPIQEINYVLGRKWMHVDLAEMKGTLWQFCRLSVAEPKTKPEDVRVHAKPEELSDLQPKVEDVMRDKLKKSWGQAW